MYVSYCLMLLIQQLINFLVSIATLIVIIKISQSIRKEKKSIAKSPHYAKPVLPPLSFFTPSRPNCVHRLDTNQKATLPFKGHREINTPTSFQSDSRIPYESIPSSTIPPPPLRGDQREAFPHPLPLCIHHLA